MASKCRGKALVRNQRNGLCLVLLTGLLAAFAGGCGGDSGSSPALVAVPPVVGVGTTVSGVPSTAGSGTIVGTVNTTPTGGGTTAGGTTTGVATTGGITTTGGAGGVGGAAASPLPPNMQVTLGGTTISAPVGANGAFALPSVPPGVYNMAICAAGGAVAARAVVQVGAGGITRADVTVLPAGQVAGIVSKNDSSGTPQPVSGVSVTLTSAQLQVPIFYCGGPVGPPIYATDVALPSVSAPVGAASAVAAPAGTASAARATISRAAARSRFISRQAATDPTTPPATTPLTLTTTSAADGTYMFAAVPAGYYQVQASSGTDAGQRFVSVSPAQTSAADILLRTSLAVNVSGTVTGKDQSGNSTPVVGATVSYSFGSDCGGPVPFVLAASGVGATGIGVAVPATTSTTTGTPTAVGGVLPDGAAPTAARSRQVRSSRARGRQDDSAYVPYICPQPFVGGAAVRQAASPGLIALPGSTDQSSTTDAQGHYTLKVPVDVTTLTAYAPGYQPQTQPLTLTAGQDATVDITLEALPVAYLTNTVLSVEGHTENPVVIPTSQPLTLDLAVTNSSPVPVTVTLAGTGDGVRLVEDNTGRLVWNSVFGQPAKTLQPGESTTVTGAWPGTDNNGAPVPTGRYHFEIDFGGISTAYLFLVIGTPPDDGSGITLGIPVSPYTAVAASGKKRLR